MIRYEHRNKLNKWVFFNKVNNVIILSKEWWHLLDCYSNSASLISYAMEGWGGMYTVHVQWRDNHNHAKWIWRKMFTGNRTEEDIDMQRDASTLRRIYSSQLRTLASGPTTSRLQAGSPGLQGASWFNCTLSSPWLSARLSCQLRSADIDTCSCVPRTNTRFSDRSFAAAGPRLWNSLPERIR